jgi:hypothetical protein
LHINSYFIIFGTLKSENINPMRKYLIIIACLLIVGGKSAFAQEIVPNGNFENWDGNNPEGWVALFTIHFFQIM